MNRKAVIRYSGIVMLLVAAMSCYRREPIYCEVNKYAVRFNIDSSDILYGMPRDLERIRFTLYDVDTEKEVYKTFMGPEGAYLHSVRPGTYKIAVWTLSSKVTSVTYTDRYNLLTAESKLAQESPLRVMVAPDHVFAYSSESIEVPHVTELDGDVVFTIPLKSVVEDWRIEVENVRGLENFTEASFYIYNQVQELYFKQWRRSGTVVDRAEGKVEGAMIVSEFGTFGMPEDEKVSIVVKILAQNGYVHQKTVDVSDQVRDPKNTGRIIKINFDTELNPLEQGGLLPSAEEWNENVDNIDLI